MAEDFNKRYKEMLEQQKQINAGAKKLEESLSKQLEMQNDIYKLKENIKNTSIRIAESAKEVEESDKRVKTLTNQINKLKGSTTKVDRDNLKVLKDRLDKEIKILNYANDRLGVSKLELKTQEEGLGTMKKMVNESSKLKSTLRSGGKLFMSWGWNNLKKWGVFEMDKEIRNTVRSMGVGGKNSEILRNNLTNAADQTTMMGVNVKELAKMQASYSKGVGRAVKLSESGNIAMAEMAEGTGLGAEFAAGMAVSMDDFGMGVESSRDLVQSTVDIAAEMGVNAQASSEALRKNLKLAQRFRFKGGVKALTMMANEATRLKLDMDGIAGLAEKVFRPEGAVEMAAKLQTMGGAFAQMADPMQLMFKARNDFEGFAKDIGKATSEFVDYNKETGEFQIKGGLAADRMREIASMTGLSVENLQEMAVQQKKIDKIGTMTPFNFTKEDKELVAGMAKFSEDKNGMVISLDGQDKLIKDLQREDLKRLKNEKKSLGDRAKDARTFEEVLSDIKQTLKQILLPIAKGLKDGLGKPLQDLQASWDKAGFYDSLRKFAKGAVELASGLGKPLIDFVSAIGPGGTLATVLTGSAIFGAAKWILSGRMLAMGFNSAASVSGGGMDGASSKLKGTSKLFNTKQGAGFAKNLKGAVKSGGGAGAGLLSGIVSGGMEFMENKDMGMDLGENLGRSAIKAGGAGLGAWGGAAAGAAIGSVVPVVGTIIGGLIGGVIGGFGGDLLGESLGDLRYGDESAKYGGKKTNIKDGIVQFHPNDNFKVLASTSENQLDKAAQTLTSNSGGGSGNVNHTFSDMTITVNVVGQGLDSDIAKKLINDNDLIRSLNTKIREEAAMILSNGKLSPTPN